MTDNNHPLVSVIMSVYNCETTIDQAINSILNQTFQNFEFIICDDCSTDSTLKILENYADNNSNQIKVIKNKTNSKLAYSLNHCLSHSQGKYIARMDGDDISAPDRLEILYNFLQKNEDYDLVGTSMVLFSDKGERGRVNKKEVPTKRDLFYDVAFNHATIMMRSEVYKKINGYTDLPRTVRVEDVDLWFKFFSAGCKGFNIQKPLYFARVNENDLSKRTFKSRINDFKTRFIGFKRLNISIIYYPLILKPILTGLVPKKIMYLYHNILFRESKKSDH